MTSSPVSTHARTMPGKASAEQGVVVLDGPEGIAVTMTPYAASETGKSLIEAARVAGEQAAGSTDASG